MKTGAFLKNIRQGFTTPLLAALLLLSIGSNPISASVKGVYVGGDFYPPIANAALAKNSGFNTIFLFALHVYANGDIYYNDTLVAQNGSFVGDPTWGAQLAALRPTINRIELVIGGWTDPSFTYIKNLITAQGTGSSSILYQNFQALKNATGVDAIQYDDEQTYDATSAVAFGRMLVALGMKVTLCPYTAQSFWTSVKSQLGTNVDAVYLQCYDGGAGNDPANWNNAFGGFKVYPGLWGNTSDAPTVTSSMRHWQQNLGITGGFMWLNGGLPGDAPKWGQALAYGLDSLNGLVGEDSATNYSATGFTGNEGFGFGAWTLSTTGGGSYLAGGSPASFGLWNSAVNGQSTASRTFNVPLAAGQSFLVQLRNNHLDYPTTTNAFQLRDSAGNVLFSYWHQGGDGANGHYFDATGTHTATDFAYDFNQMDRFAFTLNTVTNYTFFDSTTGASFSGTLSSPAIAQVAFVRANGSSGTISDGNDYLFNGLVVYVPTQLPVRLLPATSGWTINFSATPCLNYRVLRATNVIGPWTSVGTVAAQFNSGTFTDSNAPAGQSFYRTVTP
ncbi:MAG TPA: hypothetical protein VGO57_04415 [Verrucomicrobiae bacterium]|jgi:hypothetical protein